MTEYRLEWDRDFALEQAADDQELLHELLEILEQSSMEEFDKLKEAYNADDYSEIMEYAHSIKGAAFNLGVNELGQVAKEIEEAASDNMKETVSELIPKLEQLVSAIKLLKNTV